MIDKPCPYCGTVNPARVTRVNSGCAEWECSRCGGRWTVKDGRPGECFAFFPPDIDAAMSDDLEPFFQGA
jgi:transposase-like protein